MACVALFTTVAAPLCSQAADERKLEVFSWWTSGGEAAALDALIKVYKKQNPGVEIINATVAGGAVFAARPVLQTRLAGGKPPDTWPTMTPCGKPLHSQVRDDVLKQNSQE
jgi:glucose/mannose transport system substrate-binding protein